MEPGRDGLFPADSYLNETSLKLKYILLSILALFVLGAGYYSYIRIINEEEVDVWSFVPTHAVWVYETTRAEGVWESLQEQPAGEIMQHLPVYQKIDRYRSALDSLLGGQLVAFLENRRLLSSLHISGKNSFDYLFYVPVRGAEDYDKLKRVLDTYRTNSTFAYSTRKYHGFEIEEFTATADQKRFSYLLHQNYLVGSFTPFLVEDVIRQLSTRENTETFRQKHASLFQLSELEADEGNLYVNGERLGAFLNLFLLKDRFPSSLSLTSKLDVAVKEEGILLNGYTAPDTAEKRMSYLQSLVGEKPQPLRMAHLLPLRTAILHFYGFENGERWHQQLLAGGVLPRWNSLVQQHAEAAGLAKELGSTVALAQWQNPGEEQQQQLLFVELKNGKESIRPWKSLAEAMSRAEGESLYQEVFSEHTIVQLTFENFPAAFLGAEFAGFEESFYVHLDNYLVVGNSLPGIKSWLLDVERENTWGKSVPMYQFLEKTNQEMNWGYYVNLEQAWRQLVEAAEPGWKSFLEEQGPYLRQFNRLAIQQSVLDEVFYTNVLLQASPQEVKEVQQIPFTLLYTTRFDAPVAGRPMLVRSSVRNSQEVLVQDSLFRLHLLDAQGDEISRDSLDGLLVDNVFQMSVGRKGELGYLAVSPRQLYLYDASFQRMPNYPRSMPEGVEIEWVNVIDYNGSKSYRLLVAGTAGDVYMLDTEGTMLQGWKPRPFEGSLSTAPGHVRVRGKDVLYAFQKKGMIHMLNRRGESYKGFPLNLQDSLSGSVIIRPGSDFGSTSFTTITKNGELISFNLLGEITRQEQLFKPEVDASFRLVGDEEARTFLILRQSRNRMSLLDSKGNLLFEKDYLGAARIFVQYFNFGAERELVAVTDPQEEFTFLYDMQGNMIKAEPLNSCCPLSVRYLEKEKAFYLYKAYQNEMVQLEMGK